MTDTDLLRAIHRSSRRLTDDVAELVRPHGLCITEFGVLEAISALGPQPIQVISRRVLVTSGSMTYTVNQLVKKGLILREPDEADSRRFRLVLTDEGRTLIEGLLEEHHALMERDFSIYSEEEKAGLVTLLGRLWQ